jgi:hypothetical protein
MDVYLEDNYEDDYDVDAWDEAAALAEFERMQRAASLRPRPDTTGIIRAGRWPYPSDDFSFHEMSSVSSSTTECASSSSSDSSL